MVRLVVMLLSAHAISVISLALYALSPPVAMARASAVLGRWTAVAGESLHYRLVPGRCVRDNKATADEPPFLCPMVVELLRRDKRVGGLQLPWNLQSQASKLAFRRNGRTWTAPTYKGGHLNQTVEVRTIKLSRDMFGLLVTQTMGFEHITRAHVVFAPVSGKLRRVWQVKGPISGAPQWYAVALEDVDGDGRDELLVTFESNIGSAMQSPQYTDQWDLQILVWSPKTARLQARAPGRMGRAAYAVVLGSFKSAGQAYRFAAQDHVSRCAGGFLVLRSDAYPRLRKGLVILAKLELDQTSGQKTLRQVRACNPKIAGYLKRAY